MSDNAGDGSVNSSSAAASANGSTGSSAVTAEMRNEFQKVVMGILKDAVPRMITQSLQQALPAALERVAPGDNKTEPVVQTSAGVDADAGKLNLKTLQAQIEQLSKGIQDRDRKVAEAEQRAREVRIRSEVQSQFAKHMGADSPHLTPYVNHYLSQFVDKDGMPARKTQNEYGEEVYIPASQAVEEMFKGDLKHLAQQSKAPQMPFGGLGIRPQGQPFRPNQQQNGQPRMNPLLAEIASSIMDTRPEGAQILVDDAQKLAAQVPRK